jgi:site-specific DNA-methyltransferase (cytosine-N4-specific)
VRDNTTSALPNASSPPPFFETEAVTLYQGDAAAIMAQLPAASVDCIVTSPPYYGQRDYEVDGQIGLEDHPQLFLDHLVGVFRQAKRVLKPTGNLWVNLGDTYWSGKGAAHGSDGKQKNRRFVRPQDKVGERPWCQAKQQLLIPHRFAIAMQEDGWIVRADNVWHKPWPPPDKRTRDRSVTAHEYVFHFVQQEEYYYDADAVALPASNGQHKTKALSSVWTISTVPSQKHPVAVFPPQLIQCYWISPEHLVVHGLHGLYWLKFSQGS